MPHDSPSDDRDQPVTLTEPAIALILLTCKVGRCRRRLLDMVSRRAPTRIIERELGVLHDTAERIMDMTLDLNADNITED